jgi:sigma-B regulation protein RsbU (phosphoserine phosphatase)
VHGRVRVHERGACVRLSLGGHGQPLVVRRVGRVEPVGEPGSAIGLTGDPQLTDVDVRLRLNDTLVLTTDGVTEARADRKFFGETGLVACLERGAGADADDLAQGLLDEVLAYQSGDAANDVAILVLQVPRRDGSTGTGRDPDRRAGARPCGAVEGDC